MSKITFETPKDMTITLKSGWSIVKHECLAVEISNGIVSIDSTFSASGRIKYNLSDIESVEYK